MAERVHFGKLGVILATAGSAVGLGNILRFPYMTGQNGGSAFILIYMVCVLMLGIPGMIAEFIVGRHGASNAAKAYQSFHKGRLWGLIGLTGVITAIIILGFYAVVSGWCLEYLFEAVCGNMQGNAQTAKAFFQTFSADPIRPTLLAICFVFITHIVIIRGVREGIEHASNVLMPTLFVLLIIIVWASCSLPNADKGIRFLFHPDFTKLSSSVFLDALGQAFFSLSLGTACLCTYASYFSRQTNLCKSAGQIAMLDTLIAIMAGLMIFPAAFAVGVRPDSGPALIFITLPNVFKEAFEGAPSVGFVISILFYALLSLAALTSTISMHEIGTAFFREELHISRKRAAAIVTTICCGIAVLCSLSTGILGGLKIADRNILDFCDFLTAQILLPVGSLLTCIFIGWIVPRSIVKDEFSNWGTCNKLLFRGWLFVIRFVCPICILAIFLHQLNLI